MLFNRRSYDIAEGDIYGRETDHLVDNLTREKLDDILGLEVVADIEERSPFILCVFIYLSLSV